MCAASDSIHKPWGQVKNHEQNSLFSITGEAYMRFDVYDRWL